MTTPEVRSVRRAHCWLNVRNDSPIRVPPAQSLTASETRARARSRSRSRSSRVTRVRRVPNTNDSVRTSEAAERAWTNRSRSREWRSIEPEMSQMTTSERGSRIGRRQTHHMSWPPVPRLRRNMARGASRRPCEWSSCRRVRRCSRRGTSASTSRSASRSSAAVIRSNSRCRRTSPWLYASGEMTIPSMSDSSSASSSLPDGIGMPRSSDWLSVLSAPSWGSAGPVPSGSASAFVLGAAIGGGSKAPGIRAFRRRHQRSKTAS